MCASLRVANSRAHRKRRLVRPTKVRSSSRARRIIGRQDSHVNLSEQERTRWDPKDGELCLSRAKPGETLVEARSGSDVQIDRQTWV